MAEQSSLRQVPASSGGAFVNVVSTIRHMRMYLVNQTEMENLTLLNTSASAFVSFGLAFVGLAITLGIEAIFQEVLSDTAQIVAQIGAPLSAVIGVICFAVAYTLNKRRETTLERILSETQPIGGATPIGTSLPVPDTEDSQH